MEVLNTESLRQLLHTYIRSGFAIVCIGSPLRCDDRVGLELCKKLMEIVAQYPSCDQKICILCCEYGLENCISDIIERRLNKLLIIDAVLVPQLDPGAVVVLSVSEVAEYRALTTHTIPLTMVLELVKYEIEDLNVLILGINVKCLDIGLEISEEVKKSMHLLIEVFKSIIAEICV